MSRLCIGRGRVGREEFFFREKKDMLLKGTSREPKLALKMPLFANGSP